MGFFKKNETLELQETIGDLRAEKQDLVKQIKDYQNTISSFVDIKANYESEKLILTKKHNEELIKIKQELEFEKKSIAKKVNKELANIGVSTFVAEEISVNINPLTDDLITDKWMAMPENKEKHDFFKKYEKVISQAIKR